MRTVKHIFIGFTILVFVFLMVYNILVLWERNNEMKIGYQFAKNIKAYQTKNKTLPCDTNWELLAQLSEVQDYDGSNPAFTQVDSNHFKLAFIKGFDGPYFSYDSKTNKWENEFLIITSHCN